MRKIGLPAFAFAAVLSALPAAAQTRIERNLTLEPGGRVEVDTDAGAVVVLGASRNGVRVVVTSKSPDLERYWEFRFEETPGLVRVVADRKGESRLFSRIPSPSFELEVPERSSVGVDTAGGSVRVDGVEGVVEVDTAGGSIEVTNVRGNATLDTAGGGIDVRDLDGALVADTSGGSIHIERVSGDASADTSGGSITVREAGGRVVADTAGGSIEVVFARGNAKGGTIETMGGNIFIRVDPAVGLDIDASTLGGAVSSGLPVRVQGTAKRGSLRGKLGPGGAMLSASSMGGSIRIESID